MDIDDKFIFLAMFFLAIFFMFYVSISNVFTDNLLKWIVQGVFLILGMMFLIKAFFKF